MKLKGSKNKTLRRDAQLSQNLVLTIVNSMLGARITAKQIQSQCYSPISITTINKSLRRLVQDGVLVREGNHSDNRGYIFRRQV